MRKLLIIVFVVLFSCSSGPKEDNISSKYKDISKSSNKVLLTNNVKEVGSIKLYEIKSGKQIITFNRENKDTVLNREFSKDTIIHSLGYVKILKLVKFKVQGKTNRSSYYWNPENSDLFYISINDRKNTVKKSENLNSNKTLLSFILNQKENNFYKIAEKPEVIKYSLKEEESVFQPNSVIASISGKTIDIPDEERCLTLVDQKDFDQDGYTDLLLEDIVACGGNCCANSYYMVVYKGNSKFNISKHFNSSWEGIKVQKWKNRWSFLATYVNAGANTKDYYEVTKRHILVNGEIKLVEFNEKHEMEALMNIRAKEFDIKKSDQIKTYNFDLDGDGKKEIITCKLWARWGVLRCEIKKGSKVIVKNIGGKRVGFLKSKTNGMHDIVTNHDVIHRWNGEKYAVVK